MVKITRICDSLSLQGASRIQRKFSNCIGAKTDKTCTAEIKVSVSSQGDMRIG